MSVTQVTPLAIPYASLFLETNFNPDKYNGLLADTDIVYLRGRKIQGPDLVRGNLYSALKWSTGWVKIRMAEYSHYTDGHHFFERIEKGAGDGYGLILRQITSEATPRGIPIDKEAISFQPGSTFNESLAQGLDIGRVYEVEDKTSGRRFCLTFHGYSTTIKGNVVLWFKEGDLIEISKYEYILRPIDENRGVAVDYNNEFPQDEPVIEIAPHNFRDPKILAGLEKLQGRNFNVWWGDRDLGYLELNVYDQGEGILKFYYRDVALVFEPKGERLRVTVSASDGRNTTREREDYLYIFLPDGEG